MWPNCTYIKAAASHHARRAFAVADAGAVSCAAVMATER